MKETGENIPARVLVAGYSGLVGKNLVEKLLEGNRVDQVFLIGRSAPQNTQVVNEFGHLSSNPKVVYLQSELKNMSSKKETLLHYRPTHAFCCLGTTIRKAKSKEAFREVDVLAVVEFAKLALDCGVRHFGLVSALGANAQSQVFYNRCKGDAENQLSGLGFQSLHILRPSLLLGIRSEFRPMERAGVASATILKMILCGPLKKYAPVEAATVAACMVDQVLSNATGKFVIESDLISEHSTSAAPKKP